MTTSQVVVLISVVFGIAFFIWLIYTDSKEQKEKEEWQKATRIVINVNNRTHEANLLEVNIEAKLVKVRLTYETGYYWDVFNDDGTKSIKRETKTEDYWISLDKVLIWPEKENNGKS